jgi:hypothetical protein
MLKIFFFFFFFFFAEFDLLQSSVWLLGILFQEFYHLQCLESLICAY